MKGGKLYFGLWLVLLLSAGWVSRAQAYTAADYYKAGLQFYTAKNYTQAIQYFGAAIGMDPNNTSSFLVRANCYYYLGQYPQALADYQRVQALQPNDKIAALIPVLQAKINASPALPPLSSPAPTASSFDQGLAFYKQKQYLNALPMFQQAVRENPRDARAYYYLGVTQAMTGDLKDAAVNLTLYDKKQPNPSIENYITNIKSRLSPEDQQWVDSQAEASANVASAGVSGPAAPKNFGIRLEPALLLAALGDFNTDAQTSQKAVVQQQQSDPSLGYSSIIPVGYIGGGLEPAVALDPDFEIGLPFTIHPIGTVMDSSQDANGYSNVTSYNLSAFSIGLDGRYFISLGKGFQIFAAAGPLLVPVSISYTSTTTEPGLTSTQSGNFSSTAFGGQIQAGFDWHLGDTFVVSPMVGYQLMTADSFQGTLTTAQTGAQTTSSPGQMEVIPTPNGNSIVVLANNLTFPAGSRPLQVDLSGLKAGLQISVYF